MRTDQSPCLSKRPPSMQERSVVLLWIWFKQMGDMNDVSLAPSSLNKLRRSKIASSLLWRPQMPLIQTKTEAAVGTITLDHPKKRNALSRQLVDAIIETLASFSRKQIRVVVLRARPGVKVWLMTRRRPGTPIRRGPPL